MELIPIYNEEHCSPNCPYLAKFEHPFYHYSAWCWKQMRQLHFYDYWIADCIDNEPNGELVDIRASANTKPPIGHWSPK